MARILTCAAAILLLLGSGMAQEAPGLVWERQYYDGEGTSIFNDIRQTSDGGFIIGSFANIGTEHYCMIRTNSQGDILWEVSPDWDGGHCDCVLELQDGSFLGAGECIVDASSGMGHGLFIIRVSGSGQIIWLKVYDLPTTWERAYDVLPVTGGDGLVVCGSRQGSSYDGLGWLLRTDSDGDTLWTRTWGGLVGINYMERALLRGDTLVVFSHGASPDLPVGGPHAVFYDMEGNCLGGTSYPEASGYLESVCAAQDGGYTLLVQPGSPTGSPQMLHLEPDFSLEWIYSFDDMSYSQMGYSVAGCMENGYVFSGWDGMLPDWASNSPYTKDGWILRVDSLGQYMWQIENDIDIHNEFNCVRQLADGGYIAAGELLVDGGPDHNGYMLRYSPETGVGDASGPATCLSVNPCIPNPCISSASLTWATGLSGSSAVEVFDTSGRLRLSQDLGLLTEGEHSTQLDLQGLPSGCYLVVVSCGSERASTKLVLLR